MSLEEKLKIEDQMDIATLCFVEEFGEEFAKYWEIFEPGWCEKWRE